MISLSHCLFSPNSVPHSFKSFVLFFKKKKWGMKKENGHSVLRGYGEGEGGVKGGERVVVD